MTIDHLHILISPSRQAMGRAAGEHAARAIAAAIAARGSARVILASAPSQVETLESLIASALDWSRVTIFHMDEYLGLPPEHPQTFRSFQREHVLRKVVPAAFHGIAGESPDVPAECARYTELLNAAPIDVCCLGIGENGHIAFNDPPVADLNDPAAIKVVELDAMCRQQQVNDGCFPTMDSVPAARALTLTVPALMRAKTLVCTVPGPRKAAAVRATLYDPISAACPGTAMRNHPDATLYLDQEAAAKL